MRAREAWSGELAELARYLAEELDAPVAAFCRRWLAACAAYPLLRWPITTALGQALARADSLPPPDEAAHLALGRLAWFRQGRMPYPVRLALLRTLERRDRWIVRRTLTDILGEALEQDPGPKRGRGPTARRIAGLVEDLPADALQADPLLPIILRGGHPGPALLAFQTWRGRLPRRVRPWLRLDRLGWAAVVVGAVAAAWLVKPYLDRAFVEAEPTKTERLKVVRVVLSACGAPAGAGGTLQAQAAPGLRLAGGAMMIPMGAMPDDKPYFSTARSFNPISARSSPWNQAAPGFGGWAAVL